MSSDDAAGARYRSSAAGDTLFLAGLGTLLTSYVALIVGLVIALAMFTTGEQLRAAIASEPIRFAMKLSLLSCTLTTLLSLCIAVPAGYLLSHHRFARLGTIGNILRNLIDALLDIPIVLPPLVLGLALLILFNHTRPGRAIEAVFPITFAAPSVVLAQFSVACAYAVRTMRVTFDQIDPRAERVAWTLGCSRWQAFWMVMLPEARRGILTAATLVWARSLGEFGPILIFAGATRMRTEVLPTTVFLELSTGNIEAAAAVSLMMAFTALVILVVARWFGLRGAGML
jgi:molybdate transport system permease protein